MQQDEDMLLQSIYEEYQGTLRRIARALNVPNMELEDVVQETFIAYFRKYSLTWSPTRKKAMLVKILKGKAIDCLRKNGRYEKVSLDEENSVRCIEMLTTYVVTDPIDIIISEEAIQRITTEIANMRQEWKEMAVLYFLEQRTIPEICEMLEIPGYYDRDYLICRRLVEEKEIAEENARKLNHVLCTLFLGYFKFVQENAVERDKIQELVEQYIAESVDIAQIYTETKLHKIL